MINKVNIYLKSNFFKNMFVMISGTIGAQVLSLALSPIITRLYGPEAYGIMGTFNSIINIFIPVAALTYPHAIVLPQKNNHAKKIAKLSVIISIIFGSIVLLLIVFFKKFIVNALNLHINPQYLYLIPFIIVFSGFLQVFEQLAIRTEQFSISARTIFLDSLIINVGKVVIGFRYATEGVLIILTSLRNGLKVLIMIYFFTKNKTEKNKEYHIEDPISLLEIAKKYVDFPLYRAPEESFNALTRGLPVLALTTIFGSVSAGYYSLSWSVLSLPTALIGKSISEVIYPRIVKAVNNKENVNKLLKKSTLLLSIIGIMPYGLLFLFGPQLFSLIFGTDWYVAGEYARWIAIFGYTNFINKPCLSSLVALRAQNLHLIFTIFSLVVKLVSLIIGFYVFYDDIVAVALFSLSGAILNIIFMGIIFKMSKRII